MKKQTLLFLIIILPFSLAAKDKIFYGKITYAVTFEGDVPPYMSAMTFTGHEYTFGDQKMRLKFSGGAAYMFGEFIANYRKNESYMLNYEDKEAYVMNDNEWEEDAGEEEIIILPGSEKEKIQGYKCKQYFVTTKTEANETTSEYWTTTKINVTSKLEVDMVTELFVTGLEGFPMKIITKYEGMTMTQIVTQVEKEKPDDSLFEVPKGFAVKPFSESPIMKMVFELEE